jgi:hypothetical protein
MGLISNLIDDASVLKVLRFLNKGDYKPKYRQHNVIDSIPDYEFNFICKKLHEGGYIFAVFGVLKDPEGAILLDKGKLLLKKLENTLSSKPNIDDDSPANGIRVDNINSDLDGMEDVDEDILRVKKHYEEMMETWRKGGIVKLGKNVRDEEKTHVDGSDNTVLGTTNPTDKEKKFEELKETWNNGKAKLILIRLKEKGIITVKDDVYDWKIDNENGYGKNLYVYFVYKASEKLGWREGKEKQIVPWRKFNPMFPNVSENQGVIDQSLQVIKNNESIPSFASMIDEILTW